MIFVSSFLTINLRDQVMYKQKGLPFLVLHSWEWLSFLPFHYQFAVLSWILVNQGVSIKTKYAAFTRFRTFSFYKGRSLQTFFLSLPFPSREILISNAMITILTFLRLRVQQLSTCQNCSRTWCCPIKGTTGAVSVWQVCSTSLNHLKNQVMAGKITVIICPFLLCATDIRKLF